MSLREVLQSRLLLVSAASLAAWNCMFAGAVNASPGTVVAWGDNTFGQAIVPSDLGPVVAVSAGYQFSVALTETGHVRAWGNNAFGQTNVPPHATNIVMIAAGGRFALALKADGQLIAWGDNEVGETNVPPGITNVVAIAAGSLHGLVLLADGTVRAWGFNNAGQIDVPPGLSNIIGIAAGGYHNLALNSSGRVIGWGLNNFRQTTLPFDLTNAVAIAASSFHSMACRNDGSVVGWGANWISAPAGLTATAISCGGTHNLAINTSRKVVAWGHINQTGQTNVPPGLVNTVAISAGGDHNLALTASPLLTTQPQNQILSTGDILRLSVGASSSTPLNLQWQFKGANIPNATNAALIIDDLQLTNGGIYTAVVSDFFGSSVVDVSVTVVDPPDSQVVQAGTTSVLNTLLTSGTSVNYQWMFNSTNLLGATNSVLVITNVQAMHAGNYSVTIRDTKGASTNFPVTLTVTPAPPAITVAPVGQRVYAGTNVMFAVAASGTEPIAFQWQCNGTNILGATNASLVLANVQISGSYLVLVTNAGGSVTSSPATLTVIPAPPWITFQVADQNVPEGMDFYLAVVAAGTEPLRYQWQRNGTNIPGATNVGLSFSSIQSFDSGSYRVMVSNDEGSVLSRTAVLMVIPKPPAGTLTGWGDSSQGHLYAHGWTNVVAFTIGVGDRLAVRDDGVALSSFTVSVPRAVLSNVVAVARSFNCSLALKADGTVVAWGLRTNVPPGLSNVVAISAYDRCNAALKGNGTVVVWGDCASAVNGAGELSQVVAISLGQGHLLALKSDGTVIGLGHEPPVGLTNVTAISGGGIHSVALKRDGTVVGWGQTIVPTGLSNVVAIAAGHDHSLALRGDGTVVAWGRDEYGQCQVSPGLKAVIGISAGPYVSYATTHMPVVVFQPTDQYISVGTNASFNATFAGIPTLHYQWERDGVIIEGTTNASLVISNAQTTHRGDYFAIVSNAFGSVTTRTAVLRLVPKIITQPASQVVTVGQDVTLTATVTGTLPLNTHWQQEGPPWMQVTTPTPSLLLTNIQATNAGRYYAIIHNEAGSFYSVITERVTISVVPKLQAVRTTDELLLSWEEWPSGLSVQFATNLAPPVIWTNLQASGTNSMRIPASSPAGFYRLNPVP